MKYLLELILTTIIIFFVWNILKRFFLAYFYRQFPQNNNQSKTENKQKPKSKIDQKVNWDAETVDYEEVKDENSSKN